MSELTPSELRDPQPPVPGERERALVAARAHELGRRRHLLQGGGALALVAAVAVSVAALTAGGSSGPGGTSRVEAASAADTTVSAPAGNVTTVPPTTVAPAPAPDTTPAPAPAPDTTPAVSNDQGPAVSEAPVAPQEVPAPSTFTLSGNVSGNPAGTTVTLTISGPGGSFEVAADGAGNFSVSGLPAGDYSVIGQWTDSTGTATRAQRFGTVPVTADSSVSFTFSQ